MREERKLLLPVPPHERIYLFADLDFAIGLDSEDAVVVDDATTGDWATVVE